MKDTLRLAAIRVKNDIKNNFFLILFIFLLWFFCEFIFHHFCPVVMITGLPCPGCGMTRAFVSLILLRPAEAVTYNPSVFLWIIFFAVYAFYRYILGRNLRHFNLLLTIVAVSTVLIYVWRIVYVFPGPLPMNYDPENLLSFVFPSYDGFIGKYLLK